MARRRRTSAAIVRTVPVRTPAPIIRVSAPRSVVHRAKHRARRVGRSIMGAAGSEKHTLTAIAAAAVLGFAEKSGVKIPTIGPVGPAGTAGLIAWAYGRASKSVVASHVATGLLCVAVNRWAATGVIAGDDGDDGRAVVFE